MKATKAQKRNVKKSQRRRTRKAKRSEAAKRRGRSPQGKLKRAIRQLLPDSIFAGLGKHGNTQWSLGVLSFVALFWAISELQSAVKDNYNRTAKKDARHDQRKKRDPPPGAPKITKAAQTQQKAATAFTSPQAKAA